MDFYWVTIQVANLEQSLKFYQQSVGLSLNERFQGAGGTEIAFLGTGETQVELLYDPSQSHLPKPGPISLGFAAATLEEKMAELKSQGVEVLSEPIWPNPAVGFFFASDPDGNRIQFVERR